MTDLVDLAIVVVSTNEAHWLERCLSTVLEHAGDATLDVIVVDNSSTDGTRELVESRFPWARVVTSPNRGFAYGNNRGIEHARGRYVLLLNPDTEIAQGSFGELIALLDAEPAIGLAGVRQVTADGNLWPTIRRFPSVSRALGEALFSERWPVRPSWSGERVLDWADYERETDCDWTSGSFMLARREALLSAGLLDERFFIYSEEPDLCLRIKRAGWRVRHQPQMTIVHHAGKGGIRPRMLAQDAYTRRQYAHKHLTPVRRRMYLSALGLRQVLRAAGARATGSEAGDRREGAKRALDALLGRGDPPFGTPPATAVTPYPGVAEPSPVTPPTVNVGN
ncbi:MAG TPA: glycosyltransferase family 2 protein [Solirubrobacteraceae bacterium]|nr:glycosyltransferase family 2 protein [Solirubrobacteraceae bacterium]